MLDGTYDRFFYLSVSKDTNTQAFCLCEEEVALMRRTLLVLWMAALVAVMLAVSAAPALASHFLEGGTNGPGEGNAPDRVFVADVNSSSSTACDNLKEESGPEEQSPVERSPTLGETGIGGCSVFLPELEVAP